MQKEWRHFIQRVDYTSSPARCAFKKASAPWQNERALILRFGMLVSNRWAQTEKLSSTRTPMENT